jgi:hypothetical protein
MDRSFLSNKLLLDQQNARMKNNPAVGTSVYYPVVDTTNNRAYDTWKPPICQADSGPGPYIYGVYGTVILLTARGSYSIVMSCSYCSAKKLNSEPCIWPCFWGSFGRTMGLS